VAAQVLFFITRLGISRPARLFCLTNRRWHAAWPAPPLLLHRFRHPAYEENIVTRSMSPLVAIPRDNLTDCDRSGGDVADPSLPAELRQGLLCPCTRRCSRPDTTRLSADSPTPADVTVATRWISPQPTPHHVVSDGLARAGCCHPSHAWKRKFYPPDLLVDGSERHGTTRFFENGMTAISDSTLALFMTSVPVAAAHCDLLIRIQRSWGQFISTSQEYQQLF